MAKQETKKKVTPKKVKVRARTSLHRIGYSYFENDEFEIEKNLADEWIHDGYVELCGK